MTPVELVDELTYINYRHNRQISPHVSPERWAKVYGPTSKAMETRYQGEYTGTLIEDLKATADKVMSDWPQHYTDWCDRDTSAALDVVERNFGLPPRQLTDQEISDGVMRSLERSSQCFDLGDE